MYMILTHVHVHVDIQTYAIAELHIHLSTYTHTYMYTCCTYTVIYTQVCELEWIVAFLVVAITESSGLVSPI